MVKSKFTKLIYALILKECGAHAIHPDIISGPNIQDISKLQMKHVYTSRRQFSRYGNFDFPTEITELGFFK